MKKLLACLMGVVLLLPVSMLATNTYAQEPSSEAKAKIEAAAKDKAKALARVHKSKRDNSAYKDCVDECVDETDCKWTMPEMISYEICMAAWTYGCEEGCSSLKP